MENYVRYFCYLILIKRLDLITVVVDVCLDFNTNIYTKDFSRLAKNKFVSVKTLKLSELVLYHSAPARNYASFLFIFRGVGTKTSNKRQ